MAMERSPLFSSSKAFRRQYQRAKLSSSCQLDEQTDSTKLSAVSLCYSVVGQLSSASAKSNRVYRVVTKAFSSLAGRDPREADEIQEYATRIVPQCLERVGGRQLSRARSAVWQGVLGSFEGSSAISRWWIIGLLNFRRDCFAMLVLFLGERHIWDARVPQANST